ncbi:hypothetical protein MA16_Dca004397 [Dendrobium catenatum]|uniref:Uncharacterized protein n=1 Tax=Dendrobium catenatum TaxID=906689 RepID=A0A2I0W7B9_9ASPA|nr:hypothetical protein MA16_Dca004397 [Dendrobium catenatum]
MVGRHVEDLGQHAAPGGGEHEQGGMAVCGVGGPTGHACECSVGQRWPGLLLLANPGSEMVKLDNSKVERAMGVLRVEEELEVSLGMRDFECGERKKNKGSGGSRFDNEMEALIEFYSDVQPAKCFVCLPCNFRPGKIFFWECHGEFSSVSVQHGFGIFAFFSQVYVTGLQRQRWEFFSKATMMRKACSYPIKPWTAGLATWHVSMGFHVASWRFCDGHHFVHAWHHCFGNQFFSTAAASHSDLYDVIWIQADSESFIVCSLYFSSESLCGPVLADGSPIMVNADSLVAAQVVSKPITHVEINDVVNADVAIAGKDVGEGTVDSGCRPSRSTDWIHCSYSRVMLEITPGCQKDPPRGKMSSSDHHRPQKIPPGTEAAFLVAKKAIQDRNGKIRQAHRTCTNSIKAAFHPAKPTAEELGKNIPKNLENSSPTAFHS